MSEEYGRVEAMVRTLGAHIHSGIQRAAFNRGWEAGVEWQRSRPVSEPSEEAIEAATQALEEHNPGEDWDDDGVTFVGCSCGTWFGKSVDGGWKRAFEHAARAALKAGMGEQ